MKKSMLGVCALFASVTISSPASAQDWGPPQPPAGAAPNQLIPVRDEAGRYVTPNVGLTRAATVWHVRAALNVAALGCRDIDAAQTVAAYNALLDAQRAPLDLADAALKAEYRAHYGVNWLDVHEHDMTRVYNFFAQPPAQADFCATARGVLAEAALVAPDGFADFAMQALPRLEAPFTDFYARYDAWRSAMAAWRGRGVAFASTAFPVDETGAR